MTTTENCIRERDAKESCNIVTIPIIHRRSMDTIFQNFQRWKLIEELVLTIQTGFSRMNNDVPTFPMSCVEMVMDMLSPVQSNSAGSLVLSQAFFVKPAPTQLTSSVHYHSNVFIPVSGVMVILNVNTVKMRIWMCAETHIEKTR